MKHLLNLIFILLISSQLVAQNGAKNDVILKLNGEELVGKIKEIGDSAISFTYAGEELIYRIKKADILKITFASGRIEIINKQPLPSDAAAKGTKQPAYGLEEHHNKVAILPFSYLKDDQISVDELGLKVQNECFAFLSKHSGVLTIQDTRNTNAMLSNAGINKDNIKGYTMEDICNILGVEFVVEGMVVVNKGTQSSYSSGNLKTTDNYNSKNSSGTTKTTGSSSSTTTQAFENTVILGVYNDKGTSLYSQERKSLLNVQDAYKSTLEYLLKRSPIYSK